MKPKIALDQLVLDQRRLAELMQPDVPVVPESIIKTFGHLSPDDVALVMSQDGAGIVIDSMLVKNGQWAKFFLETWLDPLYRSYNFEKAERHALVCFGTQTWRFLSVAEQADGAIGTCYSVAPNIIVEARDCAAADSCAVLERGSRRDIQRG